MNTPARQWTRVQQSLLGFDARELGMSADLWDRQRRETFLLRTGVTKPLSVDVAVWPSVFDTGQGIGLAKHERLRWGFAGIPTPSWIGHNAGLWANLAAMREYLSRNPAKPPAFAVIAVSWFSDRYFSDAGKVGPYLGHTAPGVREAEWEFLGFDVGDGSLVSGLSNCGYAEAEAQDLRSEWKDLLNDNHLFVDQAQAFRFGDLANERVTEHAPFFVYGLHRIENVS